VFNVRGEHALALRANLLAVRNVHDLVIVVDAERGAAALLTLRFERIPVSVEVLDRSRERAVTPGTRNFAVGVRSCHTLIIT